ncbi:uncharacterized protein LOC119104470 [Pollicipes pollicipes]|uniref:uncharacterized protein LOC119104470 n=1 Tax=Pollicipes pollicipes TaxID=41117 RepID=UPI001885985D|nr:uncharacterized protein LOC119104470 [Pollicipes pollicipes]
MALENEVKLKYKMPFPIEVHSRRSDGQSADDVKQEGPPPPPPTEEVAATAQASQEFSFISIDGTTLDNPTIVLEADEVDGNNVVVYREPYGGQLTYDPSMSYLAQLEASELHEQDVVGDQVGQTTPHRRVDLC